MTADTKSVAPGPWRAEENEDGYWDVYYTGDGIDWPIHGFIGTFPREEDARFVVAARTATTGAAALAATEETP